MESQKVKKINYERKTEAELKQIAIDLYDGKIFSDRHLSNILTIPIVFPALISDEMQEYDYEDIKSIGMVYQYLDKEIHEIIMGLPVFDSLYLLNETDTLKVRDFYLSFNEKNRKILNSKTIINICLN